MQGAFISAHTYSPPSVLGRQLRPFSPWHGLLLEAAGSPYILGGSADIDDLIFCAWVCSKSYREGFAGAADTKAVRQWGLKTRSAQYPRELALMNAHITASYQTPRFWDKGKGGGSKAPDWWHLATFAMRELHLSEADAWDYPIVKIACYSACVAETNGNQDLMSADEIKGIETLKAESK